MRASQSGWQTPAALGYSMPAEWERHEATWIGWPSKESDWPGKIAAIHWVYAEIARKIAAGEKLHIFVNSAAHEARARHCLTRAGVDLKQIRFFRIPMDRGWTRDSGPIVLRRSRPRPERAVVQFKFNGWARYPDHKKDARAAARAAEALRLPVLKAVYNGREVVLEGGGVDVNGRGTLLTTEECLLDQKQQVRNPGFSRQDTESFLKENLGVSNVVWLGKGIAGDDTHGHVDDLCRFVNPTTVVLCRERNPRDANYRALEENRERLQSARLEDGTRLEVVDLPMPAPLHFDGQRLPASYANFYFCNAAVIVPTFDDAQDRAALGLLAELIPDRPVIGIHAVDLVWGLGTLHCLTQQYPRAD